MNSAQIGFIYVNGRADREPFAQLSANPSVMEFFPSLLNRAASKALVVRMEAKIHDRSWGFWADDLKATKEFIGYVGLNAPAPECPCSTCVEVGWRLAFPYGGNGYATEVARGTSRIGFDVLNLEEIIAFTVIPNRRSQAEMKRLNTHEMPEPFLHPQIPIGHPLSEHCPYKQSQSDFKSPTHLRSE